MDNTRSSDEKTVQKLEKIPKVCRGCKISGSQYCVSECPENKWEHRK